jgi:hypothetical protein
MPSLFFKRDLEDASDLGPFDAEVESIVKPFGAVWIGCGTFLPTMTRDWEYEVDMASAHVVAERLRSAGYSVEPLASVH